jgi:excisionase family DNA binding protein
MRRTETAPVPNAHNKIAFTINEAARVSGLSRSLLYIAIGSGALRAKKCGRRTLVLAPDLSAWIERLPAFEVNAANRHVSTQRVAAT